MELKIYQQKVLDELNEFLSELESNPLKYVFMGITEKPYKSEFFGQVPFICIKIPTGGGKTLVGCYSITKVMDSFLRHKLSKGLVLWFVPSDSIKTQTLSKFKDRKDFHRKILDEYFDNKVMIFSNEEALKIKKEDIDNNLCIVISSLDAFRKEKSLQNKYKVYQENGQLISHFENINNIGDLEKDDAGIIMSLANVIRLNNSLIIIDEGHRTKTDLSISFLKELNPSFIIEYTATPRLESNVLIDIKSSELKEEQMIKLPLVLQSRTRWQDSILQGTLKREELEKLAKSEKEYIRPIALLQAEQEKEDIRKITVGQIKEFLIKERKIPENEIAIKTSKTNELENVDLFSKNCKIKYIITVNALAEGWDCSFAYILISVANIGSKIAVEQIIGRIMRMPYAIRKNNEDLNYSYVFASAKNFQEATNQIITGLEKNGYNKSDIINADEDNKKYSLDVERNFKTNFSVPIFSFNNEVLGFEDLIIDLKLSNNISPIYFNINNDNDGQTIIDIKEGEKLRAGPSQRILNLNRTDKEITKERLIKWLDERLKFSYIDKADRIKFIELSMDTIKNYTLSDFSNNRLLLLDLLNEKINKIIVEYTHKVFTEGITDGRIQLIDSEPFKEIITLSERNNKEFANNYYPEIDVLNKEEQNFVERLDLLSNLKFWIRNRERKDPFYLQGWKKHKFYPDFIANTKKGNILAIEWKGEDRITNEDTKYKEELGKIWTKFGNGKLYFFLVNNKDIDETLNKIKNL